MFMTRRKTARFAVLAAVGMSLAACGDDAVAPPPIENPSTITVENNLLGPVLFFRVRACGTSLWGDDLLPADPVTGRINPGEERDFTVEAGCYDLQAQHLPDNEGPGELMTKEEFDIVVSPTAPYRWPLIETEDPGGPT